MSAGASPCCSRHPAAAGSLLGAIANTAASGPVLILAFVPVMLVAAGFAVGVLTGFFGVGGGFIVVPVLSIWLGAGFRRAVASRPLWRARRPWVRWPAR
jgi:uncharacterized protein